MNVNEFIKKLQSVPSKQRELPIVIRTGGNQKLGLTTMFMGIQDGNQVSFPQIGEDPNCIVMQVAIEDPEPIEDPGDTPSSE
jgi:hypothetical protein